MKQITKLLAVLLAVTLLLAGCQTANTSWVYSYQEDSMPAGVYICMLLNAYGEAVTKLQEAQDAEIAALQESLGEGAELENTPKRISERKPKEIYRMQLDGMSVSDWMVQRADQSAREYYAVQNKMQELGLSLSQADIAGTLSSAASAIENTPEFYKKNGIAENSLALMLQNDLAVHQLFHALYEEGGEFEVSQEELSAYFAETYSKIKMMFFYKVNESDLSEEEAADSEQAAKLVEEKNEALRQKAQGYLTRLQAGEAIEDLNTEYELETAKESVEGTEDAVPEVEPTKPGELNMIVTEAQASYYGEPLIRAAFDTPVGEAVLVEDTNFFFLVQRADILEDPADLQSYQENLLHAMRYDSDFLPKLEEWGRALDIQVNQAAVSRYLPSKLYHLA
ncbi:MAG: hypothetical protein ACOX0K_08495 [Oscillospiraceae bacterium]|jgi:hypothetical protein